MENTEYPDIYSSEFLALPKDKQLEILLGFDEGEFETVFRLDYEGFLSGIETIEKIGPHYIAITDSGTFGPYQSLQEAISEDSDLFYITGATQLIHCDEMTTLDLLKYVGVCLDGVDSGAKEILINGEPWTLNRIKMYKDNL